MKTYLLLILLSLTFVSNGQTHFTAEEPVKILLLDDGKTAITFALGDHYLKFWNIKTGEKTGELSVHHIENIALNKEQTQVGY